MPMPGIWKALRNRNYVWLLIGYFFLSMMIGLRESLRMHAATFYWEFTSEQLRWFIIAVGVALTVYYFWKVYL